jgi:ribosome-binding protein aMBF1 (putative translation factor)
MAKITEKKECAVCGKKMEIRTRQSAKRVCAHCANDIKKTRIKEKYWKKVAPGSTRHNYWAGRLSNINQQLKNK